MHIYDVMHKKKITVTHSLISIMQPLPFRIKMPPFPGASSEGDDYEWRRVGLRIVTSAGMALAGG